MDRHIWHRKEVVEVSRVDLVIMVLKNEYKNMTNDRQTDRQTELD